MDMDNRVRIDWGGAEGGLGREEKRGENQDNYNRTTIKYLTIINKSFLRWENWSFKYNLYIMNLESKLNVYASEDFINAY